MAFKDLFKTKAERRAYAKGRKDQFNKEHPKLKWGVKTTTYYFNEDGSLFHKGSSVHPGAKFRTKKEATSALKRVIKNEKYNKAKVKEAVRKKKVTRENSYDDFKLVKINERQE